MIEIAVVDDESSVLCELSKKIRQYFEAHTLACRIRSFSSGREFLAFPGNFDIVFLDIQMEGLSGMEVARKLRERDVGSFLIFITVLQEYVYDAFEVEASDYLLKPLDDSRFVRTMDRILKTIEAMDRASLTISQKGNTCKSIWFKDICYFEAVNHKLEIHLSHTKQECCLKIEELTEKLDGRFFQCHRSYFVNLDYVCGYQNGQAVLENGERVPVSRLRGRDFSQAVLCHMKEKKI